MANGEQRIRLQPEDPEDVRRRDRARLNVPKRARYSDARRRSIVTQWKAAATAHDVPPSVSIVLDDPNRYGHRFTPLQACVLILKYAQGGWSTDAHVAAQLGTTRDAVRSARVAAEREAAQLVSRWAPILDKLANGATVASLSPDERREYERCRKRKSGRATPGVIDARATGRGTVPRRDEIGGRPVMPWHDTTQTPGGHSKRSLIAAWYRDLERDGRTGAEDAHELLMAELEREAGGS
jgi:hypothetical protein